MRASIGHTDDQESECRLADRLIAGRLSRRSIRFTLAPSAAFIRFAFSRPCSSVIHASLREFDTHKTLRERGTRKRVLQKARTLDAKMERDARELHYVAFDLGEGEFSCRDAERGFV